MQSLRAAGELIRAWRMKSIQSKRNSNEVINSAAEAEEEILETTLKCIIMDSLWFLAVKCKFRKSLKK